MLVGRSIQVEQQNWLCLSCCKTSPFRPIQDMDDPSTVARPLMPWPVVTGAAVALTSDGWTDALVVCDILERSWRSYMMRGRVSLRSGTSLNQHRENFYFVTCVLTQLLKGLQMHVHVVHESHD